MMMMMMMIYADDDLDDDDSYSCPDGQRAKLIAVVRSPIDRLRHAFYGHEHYQKR